jgi:GT2 family glycosyltransferase
MKDTTAIIKTFWRDKYLFRCVESLREIYPDIKIIVGDDGFESGYKLKFLKEMDCEYVRLPFDCGITYARNRLIEKAKTKYVLIGDDDFKYTEEAGLEKMRTILDKFDIAGGRVRTFGELGNYQGFIVKKGKKLLYNELNLEELKKYKGIEYGECDVIFNFFLAKREIFNKVSWDENIKVAYEHSDFFLNAKKEGIKVAFLPEPIVIHKDGKIKNVKGYDNFRNRKSDKDYFFAKHKIDTIIDFKGRKNEL